MKNWVYRSNRLHRACGAGNALMEYAVPAAIILFSAGVFATALDLTGVMAEYFMAASGHTTSNLSGSTFQTNGLGYNSYGDTGNGLEGFTSFGSLQDGSGAAAGGAGGGMFYAGEVTRVGGRQPSSSPEYLYP